MKIEFYDIKTKSIVEMEWEDTLKGVPIGYIPYDVIERNRGNSRNPNLYWDTEYTGK